MSEGQPMKDEWHEEWIKRSLERAAQGHGDTIEMPIEDPATMKREEESHRRQEAARRARARAKWHKKTP